MFGVLTGLVPAFPPQWWNYEGGSSLFLFFFFFYSEWKMRLSEQTYSRGNPCEAAWNPGTCEVSLVIELCYQGSHCITVTFYIEQWTLGKKKIKKTLLYLLLQCRSSLHGHLMNSWLTSPTINTKALKPQQFDNGQVQEGATWRKQCKLFASGFLALGFRCLLFYRYVLP